MTTIGCRCIEESSRLHHRIGVRGAGPRHRHPGGIYRLEFEMLLLEI